MKNNILLVVIDCLRYDRVTEQFMPYLARFGEKNTIFTNFWSVSHCTDPAMTSLLSGKWPDELRLYSMMYEHKDYSIPDDVEMLAQIAKNHGYSTGMISNLGRWYTRGVDDYVNSRGWQSQTFSEAMRMMDDLPEPWFITVHDDSCHSNYRDGSYNAACKAVDSDLLRLFHHISMADKEENTFIFITSDHGEGLGDHGIKQHGFGLWPVLTHVPMVAYLPGIESPQVIDDIFQHVHVYDWMVGNIGLHEVEYRNPARYAHMAGRTPHFWHRAVTDGETLIVKEQPVNAEMQPKWMEYSLEHECVKNSSESPIYDLWIEAIGHAAKFGIDADNDGVLNDELLEQRLKQLGYFDD